MQPRKFFPLIVLFAAVSVFAVDLPLTESQWKASRPKNVLFDDSDQTVCLENGVYISNVLKLDPSARYKLSFQGSEI